MDLPPVAPISRFPVEVLTRILMVLNDDLFYEDHSPFETPDLPLLSVTQVCAEWRKILLNYPVFWTKIMLGGVSQKRLLEHMATHARGLPLDVKVYVDPYYDLYSTRTTNIDHVWGRAAKIRSLCIRASLPDMTYSCLGRHGTVIGAPLLERLTLETNRDANFPANTVDKVLYQIKAPRLREFASFNHPLPQCSLFPSTLQELHFVGEVAKSSHLLQYLPQFSELKRLTLRSVFADALPSAAQPIHLPGLMELKLHTNIEPLLYLLTNTKVHPHCKFDLCLDFCRPRGSLLGDLATAIGEKARCVLRGHPSEDPALDLELWKAGKVIFRLLAGSVNASPPHLQISIHDSRNDLTLTQNAGVFLILLQHIPAVAILKIRVFGSFDCCLTPIFVAAPMQTVTDLTLYDPQPYIWTEICTFKHTLPSFLPLQSLQVLRIAGKTNTMSRIKGSKLTGLTGIKQLLSSVRYRASTSFPLKVIDICGLDSQDPLHAALSEAAPTLEQLGVELQCGP
ncbi:hypothetical protein H1R20_g15235, partial [Candolleomyces eurysporus]